ncbi:unnamed protein product [Oppiella nova]|uniref:Uncharacterized protein n=1 Tax=Oppiella nova TaxID=334625 RepID=A0A7R9M077_9ACAR|nr:unnamed protein product [Oppiella nova]CAG2168689.1 unnamed protein product [Oppiella nova]
MGKRSYFNQSKYDWIESFGNLYAFTEYMITFSVPEFGLGRNQLIDTSVHSNIVSAYKNYILGSALLLGGYDDSITQTDIKELLAFESKLAKLSTKPEDMRESKVWYNRMTFKEFNSLTGNRTDWLKVAQFVYKKLNSNIRLSIKDRLIVDDLAYYREVTRLVVTTPSRVIANHMGWLIVKKLAVYTTESFRQLEYEFNKVAKGVKTAVPLTKHCIEALESYLPFAYSRKYVDNHFSDISRQEAKTVVKYVRRALKRSLKDNDWLDDITKNKSIEKLSAVVEDIGYPDWMLDNKQLDKLYNLLRKPVNITLSWPTYPAKVNAYYDPTQNTITIPAGILSQPFFRNQVPSYLNFGSIGVVIGHEYTHGFDDQEFVLSDIYRYIWIGSEYDPNGNLINWWNGCMKTIFKEKTKCFINKFSQYVVPEVNMTLNARNTVGEDISDAGGIKQAFNAFKSYEKKYGESQRLPFVNQYSADQLFFISYANIACGLIRPETLKDQIEYDPHSPQKYRVNPHLSKFKPFSDAFKCNLGTKMNSSFSCDLW